MLFTSETDLFALILTSRKPEARRFREWVAAEVLPELRRAGHYSVLPAEVPSAARATPHLETVRRQDELERTLRVQQRKPDVLMVQVGLTSSSMALLGWCAMKDIDLPRAEGAREGRSLTKLCREKGLAVHRVADVRGAG
jgi:hypothetical protein